MRDLDRVNPGVIECLCDLANMIDAVLMADRMHAVAQRPVLNVEFGFGWVERHHAASFCNRRAAIFSRSEEHTSELQSLMRISYAVFCLTDTTNDRTLQH